MCRTRNLVLALAFSIAALTAWGSASNHAQAGGKEAARHSTHRTAHARAAAHEHRAARTRHRVAARREATARTASRTHIRSSSLALRRAEARRRERREWAERERIRYEARRRRYETRAHLSRDTVHLRRSYVVESDAPSTLPGPGDLAAGGAVQPFTQTVSLHIRWGDMPTPLRGSLALLERQDQRLEAAGLKTIQTEADLSAIIAHKELVPIPVSDGLTVNGDLKENHRYCRPWTAQFLKDLARAHEDVFHRQLEVSSAVRPATYQEHLERINGNAAPAEGDIISPHMMGATIDIAKHGLSRREIAWMRVNLLALEEAGKIDVEEEFRQSCFHITVYPTYMPEHTKTPAAGSRTASAADTSGHEKAAPTDAVPMTNPDAAPEKDGDSAPLQQDDSTGS